MQPWPLLAALLLASVYAMRVGAREEGLLKGMWGPRRRVSAAAGISVAYVFVDVLPELATQNDALRAAAQGAALFPEQRIYLLALLSFVVMYGLDHIVLSRREQRRSSIERGESDAAYWLHISGYAAYSALIGYLLVERVERGYVALAVYALAMSVHFIVVNHSLTEEHGKLYSSQGHWVLAASVIGGCVAGSVLAISDETFARLFALLAGGVVITSLRSELPDDRSGRFWPFCIASVVFAGVLVLA